MKNIFRKIGCYIWGHRIDSYLIEYTREKTCKRCGKKVYVWHITTVDDYLNGDA